MHIQHRLFVCVDTVSDTVCRAVSCVSPLHNRDLDSQHVTLRSRARPHLFALSLHLSSSSASRALCASWSKLKNKYFRAQLHLFPSGAQDGALRHTHLARECYFSSTNSLTWLSAWAILHAMPKRSLSSSIDESSSRRRWRSCEVNSDEKNNVHTIREQVNVCNFRLEKLK